MSPQEGKDFPGPPYAKYSSRPIKIITCTASSITQPYVNAAGAIIVSRATGPTGTADTLLPFAMYHLYDNIRRHIGMAETFEDLQAAALETIDQEGVPYCYIRWTDSSGQPQEARVTATSVTLPGVSSPAAGPAAAAPAVRAAQPPVKHGRAIRYTNAAIALVLLFLAVKIGFIILEKLEKTGGPGF